LPQETSNGDEMKILMISPQYYPIVGGYERAAELLAKGLQQRGHLVLVLSERRYLEWAHCDRAGEIDIVRWWCIYRSKLHILTSLLGLAVELLVRGRCFDIWHVHQYGVHAALTIITGKILRRKVVLKLTSSGAQGISKMLEGGRLPFFVKYIHRQVDALVALTKETADEAAAFGIDHTRVHNLGNGVDVQEFSPISETARHMVRRKLKLSKPNIVLFVGRLAREKNVGGLLEAWAKAFPHMGCEWGLVIVGDGAQRGDLEIKVRKLKIEDSVWFVGQQQMIREWFSAADVFVMASDNEGLSNTLLEALACGLPVVATAVSGTRQLVEEAGAGIRVPIGDMYAFGEALIVLARDLDLRRRMGQYGRLYVERHYSSDCVVAAYESLYKGLVCAASVELKSERGN